MTEKGGESKNSKGHLAKWRCRLRERNKTRSRKKKAAKNFSKDKFGKGGEGARKNFLGGENPQKGKNLAEGGEVQAWAGRGKKLPDPTALN